MIFEREAGAFPERLLLYLFISFEEFGLYLRGSGELSQGSKQDLCLFDQRYGFRKIWAFSLELISLLIYSSHCSHSFMVI